MIPTHSSSTARTISCTHFNSWPTFQSTHHSEVPFSPKLAPMSLPLSKNLPTALSTLLRSNTGLASSCAMPAARTKLDKVFVSVRTLAAASGRPSLVSLRNVVVAARPNTAVNHVRAKPGVKDTVGGALRRGRTRWAYPPPTELTFPQHHHHPHHHQIFKINQKVAPISCKEDQYLQAAQEPQVPG